ncbi:hypothetical protein EW026_g8400 [Hermanssonia centrifuga]|uniref:Uncharacterized protein n=1 Tax=Hermanssonia centrifuga TaxID=98765 RepID=A0A4V3X921_9APHY|nr:hypothetical protein EW026_g8400 [Hermanssonia centrifuga]
MYFLKTLAILPAILALYALAIPLEKRVTVTHIGTINSPVNGTSITPGTPFDFHYTDGWGTSGCYPGYTLINVWLVDHEPAGSELNSTYQLPDGDYLYYFGDFLIINDEGLPPMSPPPPPSTLTLSEPLDPAYDGTEVYIAVVEELASCVPTSYTKYGLTSNNLQYFL